MAKIMTAVAKLAEGMRFDAQATSGYHVTLDSNAESGFSPMEMLLVGLAGCTGMFVISILRKKRQDVTSYEVHVQGIRADEHPKIFVEITVEHIVTGHNIQPAAIARAIELTSTRYCGAEAMLGKVAHITNTYRIIDA